MKKRLAISMMALAAILGVVASTATPAQAYISDPAINGEKFYTGVGGTPPGICIAAPNVNGPYYRVGYIAQQWNLKIGTDVVALNYEDDCAAAGYPPSRRMVIGLFSNPTYSECIYLTNQETDEYNGFLRWTNGPGVYLNTADPTCVSGQNRRDHWVSLMIGWHLGLVSHDSAAWNSRVMNQTIWSIDNVPLPTSVEGQKVREIYLGVFCDVGTVC